MSADAHPAKTPWSRPKSPWGRISGASSVYTKTVRDARLTVGVLSAVLGLMLLAVGADYGRAYTTAQSRVDFVRLIHELPTAIRGMYGNPSPANLATLGGMISFKIAASLALTASLWSILALSSTLAGEARNGSLEIVAMSPIGRRQIAVEKLAAHATSMGIVVSILAGIAWFSGKAFGTLPGDAVSVGAALGLAVWVALMALASGSVAFALAPVIGRAGAAGIAGVLAAGGFFINGYQSSVPALSGLSNLTWFGWTTNNQPLAGQFDWWTLLPVALVAVVFFAIGVETFARRDVGATIHIPWLKFPDAALGLDGPCRRSLGDRLPLALAWGTGLGLFGLVLGASASSFSSSIGETSQSTLNLFHTLFPKIDLATAGGFLELTFVQFGYIFAGFAAATFVAGWASDELGGRFDLLLSAPLGRARWAVASGMGVLAAIGIMTVVTALGIGVGAALVGSNAGTPMLGAGVLGLYALGLSGTGLAIGSLFRPSYASVTVGALVGFTFLITLIGPGLNLPAWVQQLSLTSHLGQPMVGQWNVTGIAMCLALAIGGVAISAWGISHRDLAK